ncbi:dipeptide ABC transporter ATP-binding protein [Frankia gtarii]|uniref:dipeptide ABC transporter ATP-binding protein n=1 Tax=Frankia gtarii TaxID=2950102 RepID=UPI0021BFECB5|nr:ABC transporter ATP-binding protein [Frankia gtarii]
MLLRVAGLDVTYTDRRATVAAVQGAELSITRGEVVALVGESGSGKSSLAHAILRLLPASGRVTAGAIHFDGEDLLAASPKRLRQLRGARIALIPQDAAAFLNPTKRVGAQVAEVRRIHRRSDRRASAREAITLLATAGLPEPQVRARQYPHELSGGMRQRVLIAIALAGEPDLIVADEPTSALDVTVQREVLDHLGQLVATLGVSMLLITHDLAVAADRADRVLVMRDGAVVESGSTTSVLLQPQHPYTRSLVAAAPRLSGPRVLVDHRVRAATRLDDRGDLGPPVLTLRNVTRIYTRPLGGRRRQEFRAVDDVTITVNRAESVGLVGESGSGKSTLARIAAALDAPTTGTAAIDGIDATRRPERELRQMRRRVQLIHQSPFASLDPRFTVARSITEPLRAFGIGDRDSRRATARQLLDHVGLPAAALRHRPTELSGGQRQRVAIARALALEPALLICDEPVSALDVSTQSQILELLARLQADLGISYLFISHDLAVVRQICDRIAVMRDGHIIEDTDIDTLFTAPTHPYTRQLLNAIPGARLR